jgi:hypothetical protein
MPNNSKLTISKAQSHWRWGNSPTRDENKGQRVAIWANCYSKAVEHANYLAEILKKDFPGVKDDEIEIVIYEGITKKGMMGLEFDPGEREIPKDYLVWDRFDPSH